MLILLPSSMLNQIQVREITQTFVNTAALLPAGETTEDHRKPQKEEAELVEKDKAGHVGGGGLFNGRFHGLARYRAPIRDALDGVDRCPRVRLSPRLLYPILPRIYTR